MSNLNDEKHRTDLLHRLKRAEGQLRGIQRMIEAGEPCLEVAGQMAAVRRALDSAYVRMTMCYMEEALASRMPATPRGRSQIEQVLGDVQTMLGKVR